jgi:hypothetical protein
VYNIPAGEVTYNSVLTAEGMVADMLQKECIIKTYRITSTNEQRTRAVVLHKKLFRQLTTDELYELLRVRSEVFVVEQNCVYQDLDSIPHIKMTWRK